MVAGRPGCRIRDCCRSADSGSLEAFECQQLPTSSSLWEASAVVGAPPAAAGSLSALGSELSTEQIVFYAGETSVIEAAAKAVGFTQPVNELKVYASGPAPKVGIAGQVLLLAAGPTPAKAAAFANAYAKAIGDYINGLVSSKQQAQLQQVQTTINNLKWDHRR